MAGASSREPREWPATGELRIRLLGPLAVTAEGAGIDLGPPKQRALFALLVLHRGRVVGTDRLVDLLWPDRPPRTAEHSVQLYISNLRREFSVRCGDALIVTERPGYRIDVPDDAVDLCRFERLASEGRAALAAGTGDATAALRSALELWHGEPLAGLDLDEIHAPDIHRLVDLRVAVIEDLAEARLSAGDMVDAVALAEAACREDPLGERGRELLMMALYRSGRHAEALHSFTVYRSLLRDELGLDPSPALATLQERILMHDPTLLDSRNIASITVTARNPYRGLRPFQEEDAGVFFGRERLCTEIIERLAGGAEFVAVVGPSGSGKSSAIAAGVIPRLRERADHVVIRIPPDVHDPDAIEQLIGAAQARSAMPVRTARARRVLVVMDQFEAHLLALDESDQRRLLDRLVRVTHGDSVAVLLALRADLYDRPLRHPAFAERFAAGVVNVLPMVATELESAVVEPAARAGVPVEPALLAELVADAADQPAQLPLLQFALTELFERDRRLSVDGYRAIGRLHGALTRRAEQIRTGWSADVEAVATQVFFRLVRIEDRQIVRRRASLGELGALVDVDPAAVSDVLADLARHYLVTFDRDATTGAATVEVAHEALFGQWPWLNRLIEQHRAGLERHAALRTALAEWQAADGDDDYLLRGTRLEPFQRWRASGSLRLTVGESAFLDASQAHVDAETVASKEQAAERRRLERRARRRLWFAVASVLAAGVAIAAVLLTTAVELPRIGWVYHRVGYADRFLELGLDRAAAEHRFTLVKSDVDHRRSEREIERLAASGEDVVIVSTLETDAAASAARYPDTHFIVVGDPVAGDNITTVGFADQEGAFLAGAAAAMATESGTIGFLGGVDTLELLRFEAGFVAGAHTVDPEVRVLTQYVTRVPDYDGFILPAPAAAAARDMIAAGADVIFPAAGGAQFGAIAAVAELSEQTGRHFWAIGADEDVFADESWPTTPTARNHVLTSMLKRFDVAVYDSVTDYLRGDLEAGARVYGVANGGLDLADSGGFLAPYAPRLDELAARITGGELVVPCVPLGVDPARAADVAAGAGCE